MCRACAEHFKSISFIWQHNGSTFSLVQFQHICFYYVPSCSNLYRYSNHFAQKRLVGDVRSISTSSSECRMCGLRHICFSWLHFLLEHLRLSYMSHLIWVTYLVADLCLLSKYPCCHQKTSLVLQNSCNADILGQTTKITVAMHIERQHSIKAQDFLVGHNGQVWVQIYSYNRMKWHPY